MGDVFSVLWRLSLTINLKIFVILKILKLYDLLQLNFHESDHSYVYVPLCMMNSLFLQEEWTIVKSSKYLNI